MASTHWSWYSAEGGAVLPLLGAHVPVEPVEHVEGAVDGAVGVDGLGDQRLDVRHVEVHGELDQQRLLRREVAVRRGARHQGGLGGLRHRRGDALLQQRLGGLDDRGTGAALLVDPTGLRTFPLTWDCHPFMVLKYHDERQHPEGGMDHAAMDQIVNEHFGYEAADDVDGVLATLAPAPPTTWSAPRSGP